MNKLLGWVLGMTKLGGVYKGAQKFLDGKKAYIAGTAMMIPGLCGVLIRLSETGLSDIANLMKSEEYLSMIGGFYMIANAAKGEKIRLGIETQIHGEGGDPNRPGTPANLKATEPVIPTK